MKIVNIMKENLNSDKKHGEGIIYYKNGNKYKLKFFKR